MKLVEIASGSGSGQPWTFGQETEEDSDDENEDDSNSSSTNNKKKNKKNNNKEVCNGHANNANTTTTTTEDASKNILTKKDGGGGEKITSVDSGVSDADGGLSSKGDLADVILSSSNGGGSGDSSAQQQQLVSPTSPASSGPGSLGMMCPTSTAAAAVRRVDPVTEVCPDLQVKIADLGNACWVVSLTLSFPIIFFFFVY